MKALMTGTFSPDSLPREIYDFIDSFNSLYSDVEDWCYENDIESPADEMRKRGYFQANIDKIHIKESPTHRLESFYKDNGKRTYTFFVKN